MNKKYLNLIFLLSAAAVLIAAGVLGATQAKKNQSATPVLIQQAQIDIIDILASDVTPAPTPVPAIPNGAVTLLVDRRPVLTLPSENEAQNLLMAYLRQCAVAPEGETFISACFDKELILANAISGYEVTSYNDALTLLTNTPSIVPVRLTTIRTQTDTSAVEVTSSEDPALAKGSRIIVQLGAGAVTQTVTEITYVAGQQTASGDPVVTTVHEARPTILKTGAYFTKDTAGEPKDDEGVEGKSKGDLKLTWPMRGSVVSHFGYREGTMHNGVDLQAKAGTAVTAPGEGIVTFCGERGAYGFVVDIDHGNGFLSRLTHLSGVELALNQRVFAGDAIGTLAESTDGTKKPHMHYELWIDGVPYNPGFYIG